jgi:hypothetical protein
MAWSRFNLSAVAGEVKAIATFQYWHSVTVAESLKAGTQLKITPCPIDIPANTLLRFCPADADSCCTYLEVTTATLTPANTPIATIQPYTGTQIPCGYVADVAPIDLTGRTYDASVRRKYEDTDILLPLACSVNALAGMVTVRANIPASQVPNAEFSKIPSSLSELQLITPESNSKASKELIQSAYHWDMRVQFGAGHPRVGDKEIDRMGFFWILKVATR